MNTMHRLRSVLSTGLLVVGLVFLFLPDPTLAQIDTQLTGFQEATGLGNTDIRVTIANIVRVILGFLGIIAILLVLYGGFLWMTAAGNEDQIGKAKKVLINAGIGLLIIMSAFAITQFVLTKLQEATGTDLLGGGVGSAGAGGGFRSSAALGTTIESHYPERNEKNVPRNAPIVITFKIAVDPASIMTLGKDKTSALGTPQDAGAGLSPKYDDLKTDVIRIYPVTGALKDKKLEEKSVAAFVSMTPDQKTFMFEPVNLLGSSAEQTEYRVELTGAIMNSKGKPLFGNTKNPYDWNFTVSTLVDNTPPKVTGAFPAMSTTKDTPRNIAVMINFNEPIFPMAASGKVADGFNNLVVGEVLGGNTIKPTLGTFRITNNYRTIEFQADDASNSCGKNTCGKEIYCLPGPAQMQVLARAAELKSPGSTDPAAKINLLASPATLGLTGVVDMAKNSLDGGGLNAANADGKAQGPTADNFYFLFRTSGEKDVIIPRILSADPGILKDGVAVNAQPKIQFSKPMLYSTFSDVMLYADPVSNGVGFSKNFTESTMGEDNPASKFYDTQSAVTLYHGTAFAPEAKYSPHLPSTIMDAAYNCMYPAVDTMGCKDTDASKPWCCNGNASASACIPSGS